MDKIEVWVQDLYLLRMFAVGIDVRISFSTPLQALEALEKLLESPDCCIPHEHDWMEETLREPTFGVAFASVRTCRVCGRREGSDYTAGRVGGPHILLP